MATHKSQESFFTSLSLFWVYLMVGFYTTF